MPFSNNIISFKLHLRPDWDLPTGVELLYPFEQEETQRVVRAFYEKFYGDEAKRIFLFSINPGRFGSGVTGIGFTDPVRLQEVCGIENQFAKKGELSSDFIYRGIDLYGGPEAFYKDFYYISICPLGFVKNGKNINYYDDKALQEAVLPHIIHNIQTQIEFGAHRKVAICIGRGKNFAFLDQLNKEWGFFDQLLVLPHPRWVMQYRRRQLDHFLQVYQDTFQQVLELVR
jgi:hypothetical protein